MASLEEFVTIAYDLGGTAFVESWRINTVGKTIVGRFIARELLNASDRVILDAGSTTFAVFGGMLEFDVRKIDLHTNNLAIALLALSKRIPCTLVGGEIDPAHMCTLPTRADAEFSAQQDRHSTAVMSAAGIRVERDQLYIRARKDSQFDFKSEIAMRSNHLILALDSTKWRHEFDGEFEFPIEATKVTVVVDSLRDSDIFAGVSRAQGYTFHVATPD